MPSQYDVVMPISQKDVDLIRIGLPYFTEFLPMKKLVIIGTDEVRQRIDALGKNDMIRFIEEDSILSINDVKKVMDHISSGDVTAVKRSGWYLQQFLKMKYAYLCEDEYYLVWDADTLPVTPICLWEENAPVFDMKDEYYPSYFKTMECLIQGLGKLEEKSFISEHMLINVDVMKNLMNEIEENQHLGSNKTFWENILFSIDKDMLAHSGFSEFETYGNFCCLKFPQLYRMREYTSLRDGAKYFKADRFSKVEAGWVAEDYMAVSFEKSQELLPYYKLFQCRVIQKIFRLKTLIHMEHRIIQGKKNLKKGLKRILKMGK